MYSPYLLEKYRQLFSEEAIASFAQPLRQAIRANALKISESELVARLQERGIALKKIPWVKHGYFVESAPFSIGTTPEYLLGYYFLQDAASMYACEVLAPQKGGLVLDMAAAPGGKTTYLSQLMSGTGCVIALELNRERIRSLRSNVMRMGLENVIVIRMNGIQVEQLGLSFDRVMLDAPCTGTGTVFKNPEAARKDDSDVAACTTVQSSLIEAASKTLKKGGTLVYSTCSFLPEENEFIVEQAMRNFGLKLEEVPHGEPAFTMCYGRKLSRDLWKAKRFYPATHGTQGFFIARLRKV